MAAELPLIVNLGDLEVKKVTLRHKTIVEKRVEIVLRRTGEPVVSLTTDDAQGLGFLLRRRAGES